MPFLVQPKTVGLQHDSLGEFDAPTGATKKQLPHLTRQAIFFPQGVESGAVLCLATHKSLPFVSEWGAFIFHEMQLDQLDMTSTTWGLSGSSIFVSSEDKCAYEVALSRIATHRDRQNAP